MNRLIALLPLAALGGCILYDHEGRCHGCVGDDEWTSDTASLTGSGEAEATFALDPSEAEVGETFIASLTVEGAFDLAVITDVEIIGAVDVLATDLRETELLLTLSVSSDAQPGTVDLILHVGDDDAVYVEAALTVVPRADDGSDDGSGDDDEGSSGDDDCP